MVATLIALATVPGSPLAGQERCERGEPKPTLGIGIFHCQGGSCLVAGSASTIRTDFPEPLRRMRMEHPRAYWFTVEPTLWRIDPEGPAAGKVEPGDALVAVNGAPITTRSGGLTLTTMEPGGPLSLTIRRGTELLDVSITPDLACGGIMASAGPGPVPRPVRLGGRQPAPVAPAVDDDATLARFEGAGLVLLGPQVVVVDDDGGVRWWFRQVPVVAEVVEGGPADRAGIRAGEELVQAGGEWVTQAEGVAALAAARPGRPVTVIVRLGTAARGVTLHGN